MSDDKPRDTEAVSPADSSDGSDSSSASEDSGTAEDLAEQALSEEAVPEEKVTSSTQQRAPQPAPVPDAVQATVAAPIVAAAPARSTAAPIAWLALLLALALAGGGFYSIMDMQRREGQILQRVQGLESVSGQDNTTFDQMRDNLQRQIELELEGINARQQRAEEDQGRALSRLQTLATQSSSDLRRELGQQLQQLQQTQREQTQRIADLSLEDRESWQLAEVQYLLRLANQRLVMTGDSMSAEAMLRSADSILRQLEDASLRPLRSALANDLAAVRAIPSLDLEGLYLRLDALIRQTDALVLFSLPERTSEADVAPAEDWQGRLRQGWQAAVNKLSEYVVVSRTDVPVETLMDPQYEGLVRQNMRMLLEQAQVAMLSGNERLFTQSLERAEGWVNQFFKADDAAAAAMTRELNAIRSERVAVPLPDLNASLQALDVYMQKRLAQSENG